MPGCFTSMKNVSGVFLFCLSTDAVMVGSKCAVGLLFFLWCLALIAGSSRAETKEF